MSKDPFKAISLEQFKSRDVNTPAMADGGVPIPPENGREEARAKFEAATNQELSGVFASVREEAFKKAFKKGSAERKASRFAVTLKEIADKFIKSKEGADTLTLSANKKELEKNLLQFCQDPQNLQGLKMPALEKILASASKKKMAEIEKEEEGKKAAEAARKAAEAAEKKKKTGESKLKIQEVVKKYRENRVHFNAQGDRLNVIIEDYDAKKDELPVAITNKKTGKFKIERWTVSKLSKSLQEEYTRPEKPVISGDAGEKKTSADAPEGRLKKLKQKVDIQKQLLIRRLEERLKKNDIKSKDQESLIRFRKSLFESTDFKLKIEKFRKKETSKEEERELQIHIDLLNTEIDRKISGKITEIDEFLGSLNKKAEIVEPVPSEVPSGEKYLGEEIPEEKIKEEIADSENFGTEIPTPEPTPEPTPTPEPKKPEEDPEEKERRTLERQERLAQLKVEIDQARKEYLEDEYKKTKSYARLGNFFGKIRSMLKDDSGEAGDEYKRKKIEEDTDLAQYRAYYDNKLFEYKNLLLEDAKERGVSNKELGELVKVFAVEANLKMADTHADVKIEQRAGNVSEKLTESCKKMINWYRKLPPATKLAIGVGFLGAGAVAGYVGVGMGAVATASALKRFFMGAVTGTTVAVGLESWGRGKTEQGLEKGASSLSEGLEGRSAEEKLRITQEIINKLIYDEDNKLNKIKNKNTRNLAIGVGTAALIGSASQWMGMLKKSETAQEIFGGIKGGAGRVMAMLGNQEGTIEGTGTADITDNNPEFPGYQDLLKSSLNETKIPAGTGVETGVSTAVPGVEQAEAPVGGGAGVAEAGPANEVLPEQELELSSDGTKIIDTEISGDDHMGDVPEEGAPGSTGEEVTEDPQAEVDSEDSEVDSAEEAAADGAEALPDEQPTAPQAEQAPEVPAEETDAVISDPKEVMIEEFKLDDATSVKISSLNGKISDLKAQIGEIDSQINHIGLGSYPVDDFPGRPGMIDELIEKKQFLEKSAVDLIDERDVTYITSIRKYVSGTGRGIDWEQIKNIPASQLMEDKKGLVYKFFAKISGENVANFKGNINPGRGELLKDWVTRVVKMRTR